MTKTTRNGRSVRPERRISIRSVRRDEPDIRKLAQVLIAFAAAKAEADAETEHQSQSAASEDTVQQPVADEDRDER